MKKAIRTFSSRFMRPVVGWYLKKERSCTYHGITITVLPGVFHPAFFFSTRFLLHFLDTIELNGKTFLELGAGSGLIAFVAERHGAIVTASDVSPVAIRGLLANKQRLQARITVIESDLFDKIPEEGFEVIAINPPYYARDPKDSMQQAWYCGAHHEYFEKLFLQLRQRNHAVGQIFMVFSEDCDILSIRNIADSNGWLLHERERKKILWEWNYIFEIKPTQ